MSWSHTNQSSVGRTCAYRVRITRGLLAGSLLFGGVAVASVIAGSLPASAATPVSLYVAVGAMGDCTSPGEACASIETAITAATGSSPSYAGDDVTINVAAGTYTENDTVDTSSLNSLTIAGAAASTTTVSGAGPNGGGTVFTVSGGTVIISGLTLTNGVSDGGNLGGGIVNLAGTVTINSSTVSGNSLDLGTENAAGGILNDDGTLTINSSTVSGNAASSAGSSTAAGGVFNEGGTLTINSSTVSGNTATVGGGAIVNGGTATINSSTVSGNTATISGGGGILNGGALTIDTSIVAANTGDNCENVGGSIDSVGYNLTDDPSTPSTANSCGLTATSDVTGANPQLGVLANNGGPTETLLPDAGGPAVGVIPPNTALSGAQVCPRTDQRGVASDPGFNCTIGAVEVLSTGTLSGHIYLCANATPTTTEVSGGTLGVTGPQNVPTQANPLGSSTLDAGTYTMTATAPAGYQLSACGSTTNSASQTVMVYQNGSGTGVFYVLPISPCAAGLSAHTLSATYANRTFSGLFCVNAKGFGTYTQGTASGFGWVTTVRGTTLIAAVGRNLVLAGSTNAPKSAFFELAPAPVKVGTFTLALGSPIESLSLA